MYIVARHATKYQGEESIKLLYISAVLIYKQHQFRHQNHIVALYSYATLTLHEGRDEPNSQLSVQPELI